MWRYGLLIASSRGLIGFVFKFGSFFEEADTEPRAPDAPCDTEFGLEVLSLRREGAVCLGRGLVVDGMARQMPPRTSEGSQPTDAQVQYAVLRGPAVQDENGHEKSLPQAARAPL